MPVQVVITDDETDTTIVTDDPSSVNVVEVQVPGPQGPPGTGGGATYPAGGATGQVLAKASTADNDVAWTDGTPGPEGPQGIQGPPGADGAQGIQGPPGADGAQGIQGIQGVQGVPGTDGKSYECHDLSVQGAVAVATGKGRIYFHEQCIVESIVLGINTAPTGADLIVDVNKNGVTIFTTQANRPKILASAFTGVAPAPDVTTYNAGDYLSCDVDQVGSTVAGSDLTVSVRLRRA